MPEYKNSKIYRVVCNVTGEQYIGSTMQTLAQRLAQHTYQSKQPNKTKSSQIIERGDYEIVLIEDYPCDTKEQLFRRERHFIESMDCVNRYIPLQTKKEYYEANRDIQLEHQKQYMKRLFEEDPDEFRRQRREYYAANKEQINLRRKAYRDRCKQEAIEASRQNLESTA